MAQPPAFGDTDFQGALQRSLPSGRIWPNHESAMLARTLKALAPTYTRSTAAAAQLLIDASPATTVNLLEEWESSLGLPDPCTPLDPTQQQREAAVRAKFGARGGLTIDYFIALAALLGFTVTVTEFSPARFGRPFGRPFGGTDWASAWQVNAPTFTVSHKLFGTPFGEPFATWGNTELQCRILRDAPAGTTVIFSYS